GSRGGPERLTPDKEQRRDRPGAMRHCLGGSGCARTRLRPSGHSKSAENSNMASYQYIYVMQGLSKVYPGGREVVKDVTLAFLPGAKIGVLGANGAGKSTLLRIMAGLDTEFSGEAWSADGATV